MLLPTVCRAQDWSRLARFSGNVDVRVVASDAEQSWLAGGFGKTRFGAGSAEVSVELAEAQLVWSPRLSDRLSAVVALEIQDGQDALLDVSEAYLSWRNEPGAVVRLSGKAGLYYPLISLEHDGQDWSLSDTLTPSAINTWVAEELKVLGAEGTARFDVSKGTLAITAGVFGHDDKAGTLLAFRGWALHDLKNTLSSELPLPPIGGSGTRRAEPFTTSILEIDDRPGVYGRLEWAPVSALELSVVAFNTSGDRISRERTEGAWDTQFVALGMDWAMNDSTQLRAQAMSGTAEVGVARPGAFHAFVAYQSSYVAMTRELGPGALTGRIDRFTVDDRLNAGVDNNAEDGWASTLAYRWDIGVRTDLTVEALHISSDRPSRGLLGVATQQDDLQAQMALRRRF